MCNDLPRRAPPGRRQAGVGQPVRRALPQVPRARRVYRGMRKVVRRRGRRRHQHDAGAGDQAVRKLHDPGRRRFQLRDAGLRPRARRGAPPARGRGGLLPLGRRGRPRRRVHLRPLLPLQGRQGRRLGPLHAADGRAGADQPPVRGGGHAGRGLRDVRDREEHGAARRLLRRQGRRLAQAAHRHHPLV